MEEAIGDEVVDLTGLGAEDAGEMGGLIAGERGGGGGPGVGDEAATGHALSLVCGGGGGSRGGACRGFAGAADEDRLLALMVEVDVEDGSAAMVPDLFGDGKVEEDHAFGGLAGADHGVAEEGLGGQGF